ncbi:hypothetical protein LPJ61_004521, partial [Coemansia biformis]
MLFASVMPSQRLADRASESVSAQLEEFILDVEQYGALLNWVSMNPELLPADEPIMYPWIQAFIKFVADALPEAVNNGRASIPGPNARGPRRIIAFQLTNVVAVDSDDMRRPDIVLTEDIGQTEGGVANNRPAYWGAVGVIEVKRAKNGQRRAYEELFVYTRNIYANQYNRRFAWGLTICGTIVRACLFGHDKVIVSDVMDVSAASGRRRFVSLLVNWALCESAQLGYDPTIQWVEADGMWNIEIYDETSQETHTCHDAMMRHNTTSVFGRHTRCFRAKMTETVDGQVRETEVIIKDSWAHASIANGIAPRNELAYLREISDRLHNHGDLTGKYPHLNAGGIVRIRGSETPGVAIDDTTSTFISDLGVQMINYMPSRVHRRLAMSPIGRPLQTINTVDELIVVVHDVMCAHAAILEHCRILHRDISINNILIRGEGAQIVGMLIDFDYAVRTGGATGGQQNPDRTGTPPFMSIGNLELSSVERTALDDWESLIYILCWLGTIGINLTDEQ